jgi:hypothetical protein
MLLHVFRLMQLNKSGWIHDSHVFKYALAMCRVNIDIYSNRIRYVTTLRSVRMQNASHYHQHTAHSNGCLNTEEQHGTCIPTHSLYRCLYETSQYHTTNGKPHRLTLLVIILLQLPEILC